MNMEEYGSIGLGPVGSSSSSFSGAFESPFCNFNKKLFQISKYIVLHENMIFEI